MATKTIGKTFNGSLKPGEVSEKMISSYHDEPFARDYVKALLEIERQTGFEVIELRDALFDLFKHNGLFKPSFDDNIWKQMQRILKMGIHPNRVKMNESVLQKCVDFDRGVRMRDYVIKLVKLVLFYDADPLFNVSF